MSVYGLPHVDVLDGPISLRGKHNALSGVFCPTEQNVIVREVSLAHGEEWDAFAKACDMTYLCSFANVSAERLRSRVRVFAAYLPDGTKIAQCAVASERFGKRRAINRFVDALQVLPTHTAHWSAIMSALLRILGAGEYHYGSEWNVEIDRTEDFAALRGVAITSVLKYVVHGVDFSRWPTWEAYWKAISNNVRRNVAKAIKADPNLRIEINHGKRTIVDTVPFTRMREMMRNRKGLDFNIWEYGPRYVTRMLLNRKGCYTARVVFHGQVAGYFSGIDFGRHTFYMYGASVPDNGGAAWTLMLDMLKRAWKPDGKFLMGIDEQGAGAENLFLFRQHCRVSEFPTAVVTFTYTP